MRRYVNTLEGISNQLFILSCKKMEHDEQRYF